MAEDDAVYIAATQDGLGKLISKPKMTEKYLKKPPFRFLHDIIMEVNKATGFMAGLYTTEEGDAASLADKSAKVEFLNKAISCVCFALGEKIDVSANKIVAGLEADKTNLWLQKLHTAATTAVGNSDEAVQRVLAGESVAAPRKKSSKTKEEEGGAAEAAPAEAPPDAAAGADEEAKKAEEKRRRAERKKREQEKAAAEEAAKGGAEVADEAPAAPADDGAEEERRQKKDEERRKKEEDKKKRDERKRQQAEEEERAQRQQQEEANAAAAQQQQAMYEQQQQAAMAQQQAMQQQQQEEQRRMMAQQQIPDDAAGDMPSAPGSAQAPSRPLDGQLSQEEIAARAEAMLQGSQPGAEDDMARGKIERPRTAGRKPPKVVSKVTTRQEEAGLTQSVAPPTIIAEGAKDDDDEDMFEAPVQQSGLAGMQMQADDGAPHGKLVQDLLKEKKAEEDKERLRKEEEETREEVEDPGSKGIKMGRLKRKKEQGGNYTEIDTAKLSESIQQLCQAANPLGKSIDLVHQDIASMGKELDKWKQEYREASEQYQTELKTTDELLQPLYQKIAEIDDRIAEQKTKIRNSRSRISKNDMKIQGLLESVVMAK